MHDNLNIGLFQREILASAKATVKNPKLKLRDILEWSVGEVKPCDGEVAVGLNDIGCNICILKSHDKRLTKVDVQLQS